MGASRLTRSSAKAEIDSVLVLKEMFGEMRKDILQEFYQFRKDLKDDMEQLKGEIRADMLQMEKEILEQMKSDTETEDTGTTDTESEVNSSNKNVQDKLDKLMTDQGELQQKLDTLLENHERNARDLNLRLAGLPEENKEDIIMKVQTFVTDKMGIETHEITDAFRVGRVSEQPRHVVIRFQNKRHRLEVMKKRTLLKGTSVWINEDLTKEQYLKHMQDKLRLKEARNNGQRAYWRNGKVVIENHTLQISGEKQHHDAEDILEEIRSWRKEASCGKLERG